MAKQLPSEPGIVTYRSLARQQETGNLVVPD
jgi:hypothetical protein